MKKLIFLGICALSACSAPPTDCDGYGNSRATHQIYWKHQAVYGIVNPNNKKDPANLPYYERGSCNHQFPYPFAYKQQ